MPKQTNAHVYYCYHIFLLLLLFITFDCVLAARCYEAIIINLNYYFFDTCCNVDDAIALGDDTEKIKFPDKHCRCASLVVHRQFSNYDKLT